MARIFLTLILYTVATSVSCDRNSPQNEAKSASLEAANIAPTPTPNWDYGRAVFQMKSCSTCHAIEKKEKSIGLSLEDLRAKMSDGYSFVQFTNAVHQQGKIMPSYKGLLSKREICCLYSFLTKGKQVEGCTECKEVILDWCGT